MMQEMDVVGVSIRDDLVRVLQFAHKKSGREVVASGSMRIPKGVVVDGAVEDTQRLGSIVRAVCDSTSPQSIATNAHVVCALPESKTFVRIIALPRMPEDQMAVAIRWEMEEYIPLAIDDVYYDWQNVSILENAGDDKKAVVVVAAARNTVDRYREAFRYAGLHLSCIEADSIADARTVADSAAISEGMMILFFGEKSTRMAITIGNVPIFAVSIPIGRKNFTMSVSRDLGISMQEAERMLNADGIGSYITKDPLFDALLPSLRTLADEVRKSADFCLQTLSQCRSVTTISFCGRGATIKGLRAFLVRETGIPVRIADPWRNASYRSGALPPLSRTEALDAVTVIGLALRKLSYADFD